MTADLNQQTTHKEDTNSHTQCQENLQEALTETTSLVARVEAIHKYNSHASVVLVKELRAIEEGLRSIHDKIRTSIEDMNF